MDRLKCGDTRESPDGKTVFWRYRESCKNGEYWVTPEKYEQLKVTNLERQSKLRSTPEGALKKKDYDKKYYNNNTEIISLRKHKYYEQNIEKHRSWSRSREGMLKEQTPTWLTDFDKLKMNCLYQLAAMRTRESGEAWHVDHIIPLKGKNVSGLHTPWNLQVIPAKENIGKSNKFDADTYTHTYI